RLSGSSRLRLGGTIPLRAQPPLLMVSVDNPTLFFVTALRDALIAHGINVRGPAVDIDEVTDAPIPAARVPLVDYRSAPLSALMIGPMKFSINLYEETLLKTMGRAAGTPTAEGGRTATRAVLEKWGIEPSEVIQMDGSGLSRYDYVTADALAEILRRVDRDER